MGTLATDFDYQFLSGVAAEVAELFGTEGTLFRHIAREAENLAGKDPLWDEPNTTVKYKGFKIPLFWNNRDHNVDSIAQGRDEEIDAEVSLHIDQLISAGVPQDPDGEYVSVGDMIRLFGGCGERTVEYDIIQVNRDGFVNDSSKFYLYNLKVKRRDKYIPERKDQVV